ncbi:hypothetical protein B0I27_11270 [Arcticibacter pallidicorallinus]|uniref:YceI-like domain-containing protein n=1 Tax=Arcticibacter pallidicorallinus TaxID=1259464 RepID=A0A2T0TU52_9SPHI|nr:YceI family protein [Arcticibacter pallidicorallinus]PRY49185.1 hypothetical protein B0I27_11270 [Arcticibacter pallidicorallinus]
MKCLVIYSFALLTFLLSSFSLHKSSPAPTRWVVMNGGSLRVKGTTNINTFNCDISGYSTPDTILLYRGQMQEGLLPLRGRIGLNVKLFDCHHAVMTADLRKTLKAKEFPQLKIIFISLEKFPNLSSRESKIKGTVDIELAGKVKRFLVDYTFKLDNQRNIQLLGERDVNFSDFGLTPPRKLGGMIQTDNKLSVEFKLTLKPLS